MMCTLVHLRHGVFSIIEHLIDNNLLMLEVSFFKDTAPHEIEFYVALKNQKKTKKV